MAVPQQKIREVVFQLLYGHDWHSPEKDALHIFLSKEAKVSKKVIFEAQERVDLIRSRESELDRLIGESAESYEFDRIPSAERNILRLGVYELLFDEQIPPKVAIAEAIRLGRKFSTPESATFINAVLDELYKKHLASQVEDE